MLGMHDTVRRLIAPRWRERPMWTHDDIHPGNLVTRQGRLAAVVDVSGVGVGTRPSNCNPVSAGIGRRTLTEALADSSRTAARP